MSGNVEIYPGTGGGRLIIYDPALHPRWQMEPDGTLNGLGSVLSNAVISADSLTQGAATNSVVVWRFGAYLGTNGVYYTRGGDNYWILEE